MRPEACGNRGALDPLPRQKAEAGAQDKRLTHAHPGLERGSGSQPGSVRSGARERGGSPAGTLVPGATPKERPKAGGTAVAAA